MGWIKKKEKNIYCTSFNNAGYIKHLEAALNFGNSFLFENVDEELDPMIDNVLEKAFTIEAGQRYLNLAGTKVNWDKKFRLFLTTKLANPKYTPEVMGKTSIINYTVTLQGLAEQLLNEVVKNERNDLEEARHKLVMEMSDN